jgi:hypothetical protein
MEKGDEKALPLIEMRKSERGSCEHLGGKYFT